MCLLLQALHETLQALQVLLLRTADTSTRAIVVYLTWLGDGRLIDIATDLGQQSDNFVAGPDGNDDTQNKANDGNTRGRDE